jgi:hypothetical protein
MPDDGWVWLPAVVADIDSAAVFSRMGYETQPAEIEFKLDATDEDASIAARLTFASGHVSITAGTTGKEIAWEADQALVTTDSQYHSVFFGKETADRYEMASVTVDVQGDTPLAKGHLERQPGRAVFDSGLRLDHVYWRLPRSHALLEPVHREEP